MSTGWEAAASLRLHYVNDNLSHQAQLDGRVTTSTGLTFASLRDVEHDEVSDSSIVTRFVVRRSTCSGLRSLRAALRAERSEERAAHTS